MEIQDFDQHGHDLAEKLLVKLVEVTGRRQLKILPVDSPGGCAPLADRLVEDVIDMPAHSPDDNPLIPEAGHGRHGLSRRSLGRGGLAIVDMAFDSLARIGPAAITVIEPVSACGPWECVGADRLTHVNLAWCAVVRSPTVGVPIGVTVQEPKVTDDFQSDRRTPITSVVNATMTNGHFIDARAAQWPKGGGLRRVVRGRRAGSGR